MFHCKLPIFCSPRWRSIANPFYLFTELMFHCKPPCLFTKVMLHRKLPHYLFNGWMLHCNPPLFVQPRDALMQIPPYLLTKVMLHCKPPIFLVTEVMFHYKSLLICSPRWHSIANSPLFARQVDALLQTPLFIQWRDAQKEHLLAKLGPLGVERAHPKFMGTKQGWRQWDGWEKRS